MRVELARNVFTLIKISIFYVLFVPNGLETVKIAAGCSFEYDTLTNVGLISYIIVDKAYQGNFSLTVFTGYTTFFSDMGYGYEINIGWGLARQMITFSQTEVDKDALIHWKGQVLGLDLRLGWRREECLLDGIGGIWYRRYN